MTNLVFFLEEPSIREMLKAVLIKILPEDITVIYVVFEGKQDLEKQLPLKLKAWECPNSLFVVIRDQDSGNCLNIKNNLIRIVNSSGKSGVLVRVACHELESFYLGDLAAVSQSIGPRNIVSKQNSRKFRNPDRLANPKQELKKIAPNYEPMTGSRAIGPHLDINNNRSTSFNKLFDGVRKLLRPPKKV
ncbi:MAG: DUF4276 family protein [SAR324 cluster bacterium]|nr:DUF4276 family protein [SAR324 cluster bacterium]